MDTGLRETSVSLPSVGHTQVQSSSDKKRPPRLRPRERLVLLLVLVLLPPPTALLVRTTLGVVVGVAVGVAVGLAVGLTVTISSPAQSHLIVTSKYIMEPSADFFTSSTF